jgi:hypothetical protein
MKNEIIVILFILAMTNEVQAMKLPSEYGDNQCLLIAKDVQSEFGGETALLYPNTYPEQSGHWINKLIIGGKVYYIDYRNQRIFDNYEAVIDWYISLGENTGKFKSAVLIENE